MEHGDVVVGLLVPADQHAAEAVDPAVRPLHHPPPRFATSFLLQGLGLFATRTARRGAAQRGPQVPSLRLGVAFVHTPPLGSLCRGRGPLDGDLLARLTRQLTVMTVCPVDREADRIIVLSDPGIEDYRNELLWSPERPTLLDATIRLWRGDRLLDECT